MKPIAVIGLAAVCLCSAAYADDATTKPQWFACEKDKDCGRTETACGDPIGINLTYYHEYAAYLKDARASVKCEPGKKVLNLRELHSVCVAKACSFDPAPNYGGH